jgi:hypothetical protein
MICLKFPLVWAYNPVYRFPRSTVGFQRQHTPKDFAGLGLQPLKVQKLKKLMTRH